MTGRAAALGSVLLAVVLGACADAAPREAARAGPEEEHPAVRYPVLKPFDDEPLAGVNGRVVIRGECLLINGASRKSVALWPPGTSFRPDPDDPEGGAIVDADGEILLRVGERIRGGGGWADESYRSHAETLVEDGEVPGHEECGEEVGYVLVAVIDRSLGEG